MGAQATGAGLGIMGGILGGIGGIIQSQNYHRPHLPPATGAELRLRQLSTDQMLGGGQELLGGTALYNQLAPILMSQLPGMHYVPGGSGGGGIGNAAGTGSQAGQTGQAGGATTSPMASYQQALQNWQQQQALLQQKQSMKAQLQGMTASPAKAALRKQLHGVRRAIKSMPDAATLERQQYMAGAVPGSYDIRMGGADTSGGMGGIQDPSMAYGTPSSASSLGSINDLMGQLGGGGGQSYLDQYNRMASGAGQYGGGGY